MGRHGAELAHLAGVGTSVVKTMAVPACWNGGTYRAPVLRPDGGRRPALPPARGGRCADREGEGARFRNPADGVPGAGKTRSRAVAAPVRPAGAGAAAGDRADQQWLKRRGRLAATGGGIPADQPRAARPGGDRRGPHGVWSARSALFAVRRPRPDLVDEEHDTSSSRKRGFAKHADGGGARARPPARARSATPSLESHERPGRYGALPPARHGGNQPARSPLSTSSASRPARPLAVAAGARRDEEDPLQASRRCCSSIAVVTRRSRLPLLRR